MRTPSSLRRILNAVYWTPANTFDQMWLPAVSAQMMPVWPDTTNLYNRYLWCHYRNECIALYTSTCPRNINFKYQKKIDLLRLTLHARNPASDVAQAGLCPAFTIFWVLQHQFILHTIFQASPPYQTLQTCSSLVRIATAVTGLWAQYGSHFSRALLLSSVFKFQHFMICIVV